MKKIYTYDDLTWVDLNDPTREEVREVMEEYGVNPVLANDLTSSTLKPQVDMYDDYLYLVLHFPAFKHSHAEGSKQEVDFIIGDDVLVTVHYDVIDPIHKFSKEFEAESVVGDEKLGDHAGYIFFYLIRKLYKSVQHELEYIESHLDDIEENIFSGQEKSMVREISEISRVLLDFDKTLGSHKAPLRSVQAIGEDFFGDDFYNHLHAIESIYHRLHTAISRHREIVAELRETNNSLVSTKQNEVMKVLTIMAFITFPLSLLASIFGMNTIGTPVVGHPQDFWIIILAMLMMMLIFFSYFKYQRWI